MMKKLNIIGIAIISLFLFSSQALAISIGYGGNYTLTDSDSDGFSDALSFSNPFPFFGSHSGYVSTSDPSTDSLFSDPGMETISLAALSLDPTSYAAGSYFDFAPTLYADGFAIYDDDGTLLLKADLTVNRLEIDSSTGTINSSFSMNLTNITAGTSYSAGSSEIIDAFLAVAAAGDGGATNITLQMAGDLSAAILAGDTVNGTYSGSAAPVPEPATLLLLGMGMLGVGTYGKRRKRREGYKIS